MYINAFIYSIIMLLIAFAIFIFGDGGIRDSVAGYSFLTMSVVYNATAMIISVIKNKGSNA